MQRKNTRELVHGIMALIMGLFLLGVSAGTGILKNIVDLWGNILFIPEYPAVKAREFYSEWRENSREKEELNQEIHRLTQENIKLRFELNNKSQDETISHDIIESGDKIGRITLRAPMSWWNEIRIDRGERDGIKIGTPIFHNGYLIGRVSTVTYMASWVELITSQGFMIPAVIEETRELGVIAGDGNGNVLLEYIPAGRILTKGMQVSTAMLSESLPAGLPIGKLSGEYKESLDGYVTYKVQLGSNLSNLYTVNY